MVNLSRLRAVGISGNSSPPKKKQHRPDHGQRPGRYTRTKVQINMYYTNMHIKQAYIHKHTHTYSITHAQYRTYIHTYLNAHIHTYLHTYIHTYIHTFIHTCVHTHILTDSNTHRKENLAHVGSVQNE